MGGCALPPPLLGPKWSCSTGERPNSVPPGGCPGTLLELSGDDRAAELCPALHSLSVHKPSFPFLILET